MRIFWSVAVGAALGGLSRYYLTGVIQQRAGADFPLATMVINISGSFLLGLIMRYAGQTDFVSPEMRALLTTGFCGGYTTFSTFSYESVMLLEDGEYGRAAVYIALSVTLALLGVFLGFALANRLIAVRQHAGS
jgi:fluoride exporter